MHRRPPLSEFKRQGVSRRERLLLVASLAISVFLGATLGDWFAHGQTEIVKLVLLAFTSGILINVVVEEMILAAHEGGDAWLAPIVFIVGFALFTLLSVYFD